MNIESMRWRAVYSDGGELWQEKDGKTAKYADIDRSKLMFFDLVEDDVVKYRLFFDDPKKRLIFRIRTVMRAGEGLQRIVLLGWQKTVKEGNIQAVMYIHEDDRVLFASAWDKLPEPYGPPSFEGYDFELK